MRGVLADRGDRPVVLRVGDRAPRERAVRLGLGIEAGPAVTVELERLAATHAETRRPARVDRLAHRLGRRSVEDRLDPILRHAAPEPLEIGPGVRVRLAEKDVLRSDARAGFAARLVNGALQPFLHEVPGAGRVEREERDAVAT